MLNGTTIALRAALLMLVVLAILSLGSIAGSAQSQPPPPPKLTAAQWQADLTFLADKMAEQHPGLYRRMKPAEFKAAVTGLHQAIPSLSEDEIIVGFMRIVAMVHDGHTGLYPRAFFRSGIFPVRFYLFSDGLFIQKAAPEYKDLVGARVLRIGKLTAADALRMTDRLAFADNEMGIKDFSPVFLSIPEILAGLKINGDKNSLPLVVEIGGQEQTITLKPDLSFDDLLKTPADWVDAGAGKELPLYRRHPGDAYWFEYLKDQKLVYVNQDEVQNKPDESVAAFYRRVTEFIAANPVEKLVIDLRNNGGGNNGLNRPVVIGLIKSKIDERGRLFVITGRQTFSAAQNFVNELENYTNAIFIGEPTAGHPNHYGDNRAIMLPNSKLEARVSTLYWQDVDPRDDRPWTPPEIAAELSSEDYRTGRDPALQAVLDYSAGESFTGLLNPAASQSNLADFTAKYRAFKRDPRHKFVNTEGQMNRAAYFLLQQKRAAEALELFKLNAESYPKSANVFDSLGDGYVAVGNTAEAIKSYERALAIDPTVASSREQLNKLRRSP
ncbi:MAG: hypothetical protein ABIP75_05435 [Pyrinomonadaceae bacterium]